MTRYNVQSPSAANVTWVNRGCPDPIGGIPVAEWSGGGPDMTQVVSAFFRGVSFGRRTAKSRIRHCAASAHRWLVRLGWLGLWLVARHTIRVWLTPPEPRRGLLPTQRGIVR